MELFSHHLILAILWLSPALQALGIVGAAAAAYSFRRSLGAHNLHTPTLVALGSVLLFLHLGYFLGPHWWMAGRHLLAAATMLPVALTVIGALVVVLFQTDLIDALARNGAPARLGAVALAGALLLAYLGPLFLMLAASA